MALHVLTPEPDDSKVPKWICYMIIIQAFGYNTMGIYSGIYLRRQPNKGINLSPSKMSMWNSILLALLTHILLIKQCVIHGFTLKILV